MKNVLEYLEDTLKNYPRKVGFVDSSRESTFYDTAINARRIGSFLLKAGSRRPVIILIGKSINCIEVMFGSLYSNDYYIVADVNSPVNRLESIVSILESPIFVTDYENRELAEKLTDNYFIYEEMIKHDEDNCALKKIRSDMCDKDTAYILFTSGSTGIPKGTVISHRSLISYIEWVTSEFCFDNKTVFGSQTPLYFSMSVTDLFSTIKCACTYNIIPKVHFSFPIKLIQYLNDYKINTIYWVPTAISILSNWKVFDVLKPLYLNKVLFAGEVMPTKQLNYWIKNLPADIIYANLFGPTETTDICTFYIINREFSDDETLPIGAHCDNCDVFIINDRGERALECEEGELYVRSSFLADGYYNNPEKTKEAFVQNPLNQAFPETVYRTGDIVRRNSLGELIYITRKDFQIKRMGYRIELGEIEASVNSIENVKSCACIYNNQKDSLILLYEGGIKNPNDVLDIIKLKVPVYMLPDKAIRIREMPVNANGKIDRQALIKNYA